MSSLHDQVKTLGRVLQKRRLQGKSDFSPEGWKRYVRRVHGRLLDVREEAIKNRELSPKQMFDNFLILMEMSSELRTVGEHI